MRALVAMIGVMIVVVLGLVAANLWRNLQNDEQLTSPLPRATAIPIEEPFWGKVVNYKAISRSVLEVKIRLLNTGNQIDEGECDLIAYDRVGAVISAPVTTGGPATPSYRVIVTTRMKIPDKGADNIKRVEVSC